MSRFMARIAGWFNHTESESIGNSLEREKTHDQETIGSRHLDDMGGRIVEKEIKSGGDPEAT